MVMESDSVGVLLPKVALPYLRQWAENSGFEVLSKLLMDDQFLSLIARYGEQLVPPPKPHPKSDRTRGNANGQQNRNAAWQTACGSEPGDAEHSESAAQETEAADIAQLYQRVNAMEQQLLAQQAILETLRTRARPLALALGCCPECVVGLMQCPRCFGQSRVGRFDPDVELLRTLVLEPLAARGILCSADRDSNEVSSPKAPEEFLNTNGG